MLLLKPVSRNLLANTCRKFRADFQNYFYFVMILLDFFFFFFAPAVLSSLGFHSLTLTNVQNKLNDTKSRFLHLTLLSVLIQSLFLVSKTYFVLMILSPCALGFQILTLETYWSCFFFLFFFSFVTNKLLYTSSDEPQWAALSVRHMDESNMWLF